MNMSVNNQESESIIIDSGNTLGNTLETDKLINKITLECLLNKSQYDKYLSSNVVNLSLLNKRDKKFYRKRILQLAKNLLLNVQEEALPNDIVFAFENFVKLCSQYFKMIDKTDIIQGDYHLEESSHNILDNNIESSPTENTDDANKLMLRSIKTENYTLDKFIKIKTIIKEQPIIPVQKEINLKDPSLRIKGVVQSIGKKKNIDINYEPDQKKTETQEKTHTQL